MQSAMETLDFEETVAGIARGLQAAAEGRERPFEDYVAEVYQRRLVRTQSSSQELTPPLTQLDTTNIVDAL